MTRDEYQGIDDHVRAKYGEAFDWWQPNGPTSVVVRLPPKVDKVLMTITGPPESYPDTTTNPADPPTVDGTSITRDVR